MSNAQPRWWKLPKCHPIRIYHEFSQARHLLKMAKARAADDGAYAMRDTAYQLAQKIYRSSRPEHASGGGPA